MTFWRRRSGWPSSTSLCYVNADIILMSDFGRAVGETRRTARFLLAGRRWNMT